MDIHLNISKMGLTFDEIREVNNSIKFNVLPRLNDKIEVSLKGTNTICKVIGVIHVMANSKPLTIIELELSSYS